MTYFFSLLSIQTQSLVRKGLCFSHKVPVHLSSFLPPSFRAKFTLGTELWEVGMGIEEMNLKEMLFTLSEAVEHSVQTEQRVQIEMQRKDQHDIMKQTD